MRNRPDGGAAVDYECELDGVIAPPVPIAGCTSTVTAEGVELEWGATDLAVVRKNGNWHATVNNGTQMHLDQSGTPADSYLVRSYMTGTPVDYLC